VKAIEGRATRTNPPRAAPSGTPRRSAADPRDVALGLAVVGVRATASAVRLALLPARLAARTPPFRGAAERLAFEGRMSRRRLGAAGDQLLAAPTLDAVGRSLAEHRVVERVARPMLEATDVEALLAEALENERTQRLVEQAWDSRLTGDVTEHVLSSPELERVVEQVMSSPAVRAGLTHGTTSLAGEVGEGVRRRAERLDDAAERTVRRWLRRPPRAQPS
jgi:hypothetical protein